MSFDLLAPHYRWMEWILAGGKLQRCRTAFLENINSPSRILLMGEGHGRFLEVCAAQFPKAHITVLDSSEGMLNQARKRYRNQNHPAPIHFEQCDALNWKPPVEKFDLIATNFFLDCFSPEQLAALIPKLAEVLEPNGVWLIADFCTPESGWQRLRALLIHAAMYSFFRAATDLSAKHLTPPDPFLADADLHLEKRCIREWGLLHADLWRKKFS